MNESPTLRRFLFAQCCLAFVCGSLLSFQAAENAWAQSKDYGPGSGDLIPQQPSARDRAASQHTEGRLSRDRIQETPFRPRPSLKTKIAVEPDPANPIIRRKWGEPAPADATRPANQTP